MLVTLKYGLMDTVRIPPLGFSPSLPDVCLARSDIIVAPPGCRTVSNNGSGSGLAPAQNILAVQVWFRFTQEKYYWFRFGSGSLT